MKICELLKPDHIFLDLKPGDKRQVLEEFVKALKKRGLIKAEKTILKEILKRESIGSTGLEKGIAVPHALISKIKEPLLAMALFKRGIDFGSADQKPTRAVLLLLGNKDFPGTQLKILAHICRLVKETNFVSKLKKAKSHLDVCSIIEEEERKI